jgi:hypothetical protein
MTQNPYESPIVAELVDKPPPPRKRQTVAGIIRWMMAWWAIIFFSAVAFAVAVGGRGIGQWEVLFVPFVMLMVLFIGIYRMLGLIAGA